MRCRKWSWINLFPVVVSESISERIHRRRAILACLINIPPAYWFLVIFLTHPPRILFGPPVYQFSQSSISGKFSNIHYRLNVFYLISVCERYVLVENQRNDAYIPELHTDTFNTITRLGRLLTGEQLSSRFWHLRIW